MLTWWWRRGEDYISLLLFSLTLFAAFNVQLVLFSYGLRLHRRCCNSGYSSSSKSSFLFLYCMRKKYTYLRVVLSKLKGHTHISSFLLVYIHINTYIVIIFLINQIVVGFVVSKRRLNARYINLDSTHAFTYIRKSNKREKENMFVSITWLQSKCNNHWCTHIHFTSTPYTRMNG